MTLVTQLCFMSLIPQQASAAVAKAEVQEESSPVAQVLFKLLLVALLLKSFCPSKLHGHAINTYTLCLSSPLSYVDI